MRFMGSMCVAGEDRLDLGRRWRTSLPDTEPIPGEDGAHCHLLKKVDCFQSFS